MLFRSISFGQTPYHATSTGHGNYPGSDGFIPGYGYYPGPFPSRYPWLNGPESPDYRSHGTVITAAPEVTPAGALVTVRVPADAEIWFSGDATAQRGEWRSFATPPLEAGRILSYQVRVRWRENGHNIEKARRVDVRSGDRLTIDFLAAPGGDPSLPLPRKIDGR